MSSYIPQGDLATYGLPAGTTAAQIRQASALVDAFLKRPEGLQWDADFAGNPCYMDGLSPRLTQTAASAIEPGSLVFVPLSNVARGVLTIVGAVGEAVILDRGTLNLTADPPVNKVEACVVHSVQSDGITLCEVLSEHASGCTIDFGLTVRQQMRLPAKRSLARISQWPIARLVSGAGSYRYGRRNEQNAGLYADQSVLAMMQTFGGPPEWTPFDVDTCDFEPMTGEVWIPSGIFLAYYSDVRVWYVAGYPAGDIPEVVKWATAAAVNGVVNTADLAGGLKMARAGDHQLERFTNSVLDDDMRAQLSMYRAHLIV